MKKHELFTSLPVHLTREVTEVLAASASVRIERIVSRGHRSPDDSWYDQAQAEFVVVLQGQARLRFESQEELLEMMPGDAVNIPAHQRHRVEWTTRDEPTIWLAVFYDQPDT